jgi:murein DD-endopeptidase MepM/ murein hydrolase activator NlpD
MLVADIFSGQIDFDSDLQPGTVSRSSLRSRATTDSFRYGAVVARFLTDGRDLRAFRWTDPATGKPAFYDENGRSLKRFFLRSPLRFEPASRRDSRGAACIPSIARIAHTSVSTTGPAGAPVVAVASGTVLSAG